MCELETYYIFKHFTHFEQKVFLLPWGGAAVKDGPDVIFRRKKYFLIFAFNIWNRFSSHRILPHLVSLCGLLNKLATESGKFLSEVVFLHARLHAEFSILQFCGDFPLNIVLFQLESKVECEMGLRNFYIGKTIDLYFDGSNLCQVNDLFWNG